FLSMIVALEPRGLAALELPFLANGTVTNDYTVGHLLEQMRWQFVFVLGQIWPLPVLFLGICASLYGARRWTSIGWVAVAAGVAFFSTYLRVSVFTSLGDLWPGTMTTLTLLGILLLAGCFGLLLGSRADAKSVDQDGRRSLCQGLLVLGATILLLA